MNYLLARAIYMNTAKKILTQGDFAPLQWLTYTLCGGLTMPLDKCERPAPVQ